MFELRRNGVRWMPSTPANSVGNISYAYIKSLSCTLEIAGNQARLNSGAWRAMPCFLVNGLDMIGVKSYPSGIFHLQFIDTSAIFNNMTSQDNVAQLVQSVAIDFVNTGFVSKNVTMISAKDSATASFSISPATMTVPTNSRQSFVFTRTPKKQMYWGSMKDGGAFGFEVIDA